MFFLFFIISLVAAEDQTRWETLLTGDSKGEVSLKTTERSSYNNNYGLVNRNLPINGQVYEIKNHVHRLGLLLLRGTRDEVKDAIETAKQLLAKAKEIRRDVIEVVRESRMRTKPLEERSLTVAVVGFGLAIAYPVVSELRTIEHKKHRELRLLRYTLQRLAYNDLEPEELTTIRLNAERVITEDLNPSITTIADATYLYEPAWLLGSTILTSTYVEASSTNELVELYHLVKNIPREMRLSKLFEQIDSFPVEPSSAMTMAMEIHSAVEFCWDWMQRARRLQINDPKADISKLLGDIQTTIDTVNGLVEDLEGEPFKLDHKFALLEVILMQSNLFMFTINGILENGFAGSITRSFNSHRRISVLSDEGVTGAVDIMKLVYVVEEEGLNLNFMISEGTIEISGEVAKLQEAIDDMFIAKDKLVSDGNVIEFDPTTIQKVIEVDVMIAITTHWLGYLKQLVDELGLQALGHTVNYGDDIEVSLDAKADTSLVESRSDSSRSFIEKWL